MIPEFPVATVSSGADSNHRAIARLQVSRLALSSCRPEYEGGLIFSTKSNGPWSHSLVKPLPINF
jgi:hypothetical protein